MDARSTSSGWCAWPATGRCGSWRWRACVKTWSHGWPEGISRRPPRRPDLGQGGGGPAKAAAPGGRETGGPAQAGPFRWGQGPDGTAGPGSGLAWRKVGRGLRGAGAGREWAATWFARGNEDAPAVGPGRRVSGAEGGTRTHTVLRPADFESAASTIPPLRRGRAV